MDGITKLTGLSKGDQLAFEDDMYTVDEIVVVATPAKEIVQLRLVRALSIEREPKNTRPQHMGHVMEDALRQADQRALDMADVLRKDHRSLRSKVDDVDSMRLFTQAVPAGWPGEWRRCYG